MKSVLKTYFFILVIALGLELSGCRVEEIEIINPTPEPSLIPSPLPSPSLKPENPIATGIEYFNDGNKIGNIWKPVSDTSGNLVIVFNAKWKVNFSGGCFIERTDGKKEKLFCDDNGFYKCFGNPDKNGPRLHLRSKIKCSQAKEVKVLCYEDKQTVTFTVIPEKLKDVCVRHD